jgi:glycosyltransferase involved in cell wall biosynthesis
MPDDIDRRIAVLIPCLNEEATIGLVVKKFKAVLPGAALYVVDYKSTDDTERVAREAGAVVMRETRCGKGHAVRKPFREVEADRYILVDGDDTYPAEDAPRLLQPILDNEADIVVVTRPGTAVRSDIRWINRIGNRLLLGTLNLVFGMRLTDLLSGYRIMTREYVKQAPVLASGFELETELSILAFERGFRTVEIPVRLRNRPVGSHSKIRVWGDGVRILAVIFALPTLPARRSARPACARPRWGSSPSWHSPPPWFGIPSSRPT